MPDAQARGQPEVEVVEATRDEGKAMLDRAAREVLNMSGEEFLARWDAGEYDDTDDPAVARVAMLIPFARQEPARGGWRLPGAAQGRAVLRGEDEDHLVA